MGRLAGYVRVPATCSKSDDFVCHIDRALREPISKPV